MDTEQVFDSPIYNETYNKTENLINQKNFFLARQELDKLSAKTARWHFLYSQILFHIAWFDSAKSHLETVIYLDPQNSQYKESYIKLLARPYHYGQPSFNRFTFMCKEECSQCYNNCCECCCSILQSYDGEVFNELFCDLCCDLIESFGKD